MTAAFNTVLQAILQATPAGERIAVCAAWDGLLPERREFLSSWSPAFIAEWLRGLLGEWDDEAPLNSLPEGGYARRVFTTDPLGAPRALWCRVATRSATVGELISCEDGSLPANARIAFELHADGTAWATCPVLERQTFGAERRTN